jgi:hypothetical protein
MLLTMALLVYSSAKASAFEYMFPTLALFDSVSVTLCEFFVNAMSALFDARVSIQRMQVIHWQH